MNNPPRFLEPALIPGQDKLHEAIVSLSLGKVESNLRLGPNIHSNTDGEEIITVEQIALEDEGVKAEIAKLQLPEGTVIISDPWIYGKSTLGVRAKPLLTLQALMESMRVFSGMKSGCSNASSTSVIQTTPAKRTATTTPCRSAFRQSSVLRL
jgi:hypothetical protein